MMDSGTRDSPQAYPRLLADEHGVWQEDGPGRRFGIEWKEIVRVTGYKLDCITETYPCVELDFEFGEYIELNASFPGFESVILAITERLPLIDSAWFQNVMRLTAKDAAIQCWIRA